MISRVQMRHAMKTSVSIVILLTLFALCAHGGEVEKFIRETLAEQRTRSALESNSAAEVIDDAVKGQKMPELELPKESVFTSKDKERDARYYKYDKTGKLISVEYAAKPEKNEYYAYDRQGNIIEKRMGDKVYKYTYDTGNQLKEMSSPEGKREYFYDRAGRLVSEKLNGEIDVEYKYGYLDKVIEVNRNGKTTKFAYDGFGMLAQKTFHDGSTEVWVWDGLALIRRGSDIYVNEPHVSGGTPLLTKTDKGVRYHTSDFLGTTLWSTDTRGKALDSYADTSVFGEGSIQQDRAARFTGKPYDEDLQAYVFPYRNYDPKLARWTSSDPAGFPDGINQHYYACVPTIGIDPWGLNVESVPGVVSVTTDYGIWGFKYEAKFVVTWDYVKMTDIEISGLEGINVGLIAFEREVNSYGIIHTNSTLSEDKKTKIWDVDWYGTISYSLKFLDLDLFGIADLEALKFRFSDELNNRQHSQFLKDKETIYENSKEKFICT